LLGGVALAPGCSGRDGDRSVEKSPPSPLGRASRIRDLIDPQSPTKAVSGAVVSVSGASIVHVDTFDETGDGSSRGTIYIQDYDSATKPPEQRGFSGIGLFSPTFVPSDLKVAPGDVLDFVGLYQENASIGAAVFRPGQPLIQLARPVGTFRFEAKPLEPTEINVEDLTTYATGRKWIGSLVTVKNVSILTVPSANRGRVTAVIAGEPDNRDSPVISNEFIPLDPAAIPIGKKFKSITGVVTYFFNLKIAPRSMQDLVAE
jgi:hypothetical protein